MKLETPSAMPSNSANCGNRIRNYNDIIRMSNVYVKLYPCLTSRGSLVRIQYRPPNIEKELGLNDLAPFFVGLVEVGLKE